MKERTIYALGFFDGVHLGHQALLTACLELAREQDCRAGVVTFIGHPDTLVAGKTPPLINTAADRERLLRLFGMAQVQTLNFDRKLMHLSWQDFFSILLEMGASGLVCGADFRFGHKGEGDAQKLLAACKEAGIPCTVVPQQSLGGTVVSSTHIRKLLQAGDMDSAVQFLGHPHILTGTVKPGQQLGRTMGIPTANLWLPEELLVPKFGVYACMAEVNGQRCPAVTNIGTRPTVDGCSVTVEAWLLDFSGDLYGKEITLEFYKFLRPEKKFPSLFVLQAEIQRNRRQTLNFFEKK